jgi:hypothetical protein
MNQFTPASLSLRHARSYQARDTGRSKAMDQEAELTSEVCYQAFRTHYYVAQYHWVQFTTEWLAECSRAFKGDLQMMVILAVVGQPHLEHRLGPERRDEDGQPVLRSVNASRIADVTGIPRETVRRKLERMAQLGWVQQMPDASWSIRMTDGVAPVREAMGPIEDASMRKVSRFVANFVPLTRRLPGPELPDE